MGLLSEAFTTVVEVQRQMDGMVFDYAAQQWVAPTPESLAAADNVVSTTIGAMVDLVPFPIQASVLGIIKLNITRTQVDTMLAKIQGAIKNYVSITRINM